MPNTPFESIRRELEEREHAWLDPRAAKSDQSRGRVREEDEDPIRLAWQRDRDRVLHSKAFRRLKHKTQVFVSPERDHYRTRLTHTLEVAQVSRTVARALKLNEDLVEAIGLGHDIGHAPYGHVGEAALDAAYRSFVPGARFRHYEQSLRIVEELENGGRGLNLTWETRDGILHHSKGKSDLMLASNSGADLPATLEGQVVRICDRVAYVNHDIDDAIRAGLIKRADLPPRCVQVLGASHGARITTMVLAIVDASSEIVDGRRVARETIEMDAEVRAATDELKNWMFQNVYLLESVDETPRAARVIRDLFGAFMEKPQLMRGDYAELCECDSDELRARGVCDYIAGMTDRFASAAYARMFLPSSWAGAE
jgi:dGTPase